MSDTLKEGGMLGMVGVVDVVEIEGDVVKQGGAAVVPLRCVGGGGNVIVEVP